MPETDELLSFPTSTTIANLAARVLAVSRWWTRTCCKTYFRQRNRRRHTWHMYFGAPPCRTSTWRRRDVRRENVKLHCLQTSSSSRPRYFSGRRWGWAWIRWSMRLASRVNCSPQPSHVCWQLCRCSCRWWIRSVNALPRTLPHLSHRCSMDPRWTVEMWSSRYISLANVREQYSHTNDFCAWKQQNWLQQKVLVM